MHFIGITGGVGAGKSEILAYIRKKYRCEIYLADEVAHLVKQPGTQAYQELLGLLGGDIVDRNRQIDRQVMADRIFGQAELLEKVNGIIHREEIFVGTAGGSQGSRQGGAVFCRSCSSYRRRVSESGG